VRFGVDASCWANGRGYGRYARELVTAMAARAPDDEFVCFLDERAARVFELSAPNVRTSLVAQSRSPTEAAVANDNRSPADMLRFTRAVWREGADAFFSPSVYTYFPLPPRQRAVVAVHDAIADRFPHLTLPSARARLFWRLKVGLALRQARLILTVSDYARREIMDVLHVEDRRIRVAVEAPAEVYTPEADADAIAAAAAAVGLPPGARWFTYVGGFNPHKNVEAVVRAHAELVQERGDPPHLLLVGSKASEGFHGDFDDVVQSIRAAGTDDLVHCPGFVSDEELRKLHSGSLGLLLLSESEGFGLPAVEAAACGCPVIATTSSPLPELLAGGGYFTSPGDVGAAARAMAALADDLAHRERLGREALRRARSLDWGTAADAALGALREVVA
jgi:glycosyltransferase involved in cell wall biosynthesis